MNEVGRMRPLSSTGSSSCNAPLSSKMIEMGPARAMHGTLAGIIHCRRLHGYITLLGGCYRVVRRILMKAAIFFILVSSYVEAQTWCNTTCHQRSGRRRPLRDPYLQLMRNLLACMNHGRRMPYQASAQRCKKLIFVRYPMAIVEHNFDRESFV